MAVSEDQMQAICDGLAEGKSLTQIVKADGMPSYRSVTRAVQKDEELYEMYRKGRVLQAEFYADQLVDLATAPLDEGMDPRQLNAEVQRRRLEIDTLKWTFARIQPYGLRDKKEDQPTNNSITISWDSGEPVVEPADG